MKTEAMQEKLPSHSITKDRYPPQALKKPKEAVEKKRNDKERRNSRLPQKRTLHLYGRENSKMVLEKNSCGLQAFDTNHTKERIALFFSAIIIIIIIKIKIISILSLIELDCISYTLYFMYFTSL